MRRKRITLIIRGNSSLPDLYEAGLLRETTLWVITNGEGDRTYAGHHMQKGQTVWKVSNMPYPILDALVICLLLGYIITWTKFER